jgi:RNA polymerase primary sigma factor
MRQLKIAKSITNRESASLDKYLMDIARFDLVTAEEEVRLAQAIRLGDQAALKKLTSANLRFVVSVAKQYQHQGLSLPDLINEGNLGLIKAAARFDETRGFKFISYAVWWIRQSIIQAISEQSRVVRLPLNKIGTLNKIRKAQGYLEQELERKPTDEELATKLQVSEEEIRIAQRSANWHVSTDSPIPGAEETTLLDIVYDADGSKPDDSLMHSSLQTEINRSLSTLTERERSVLELYYGIGFAGGMSLEEIGNKYDLTRERVRQIKEKAVRKLRNSGRTKNLKSYL